jgi:hypothetical protein
MKHQELFVFMAVIYVKYPEQRRKGDSAKSILAKMITA